MSLILNSVRETQKLAKRVKSTPVKQVKGANSPTMVEWWNGGTKLRWKWWNKDCFNPKFKYV